jgi:hypothetical protein
LPDLDGQESVEGASIKIGQPLAGGGKPLSYRAKSRISREGGIVDNIKDY